MVRGISEGAIWTTKNNKIDAIILVVFSATFLFLLISEKKTRQDSYSELFLEADDIIIIGVVLTRYAIQIVQAVKAIRNTRKNMIIQRNMRDVDLNNKDINHSVVYDGEEDKQDEIIRSKLSKKQE